MKTVLRELSAPHRTERGDTRLGVVLAFVAGAVNAGGFLAVGAYTSHMSGMVSSIADYAVDHQWQAALLIVPNVVAFFAGSMISALLINWARLKQLASEFALPLAVEAGLLLLFGGLAAAGATAGALGLHAVISLLCLVMGLQNGLITKISHSEIRTTHMTGVITDLGIEAGRFLFGKATHTATRFNPAKARRLALLLAAFMTGGLAGALLFRLTGYAVVLPLAAALVIAGLVPLAEDLSRLKR